MITSIVNLSLPVGDPNRVINIQGYQAESYSESPSQPNFDSIDIDGRSSPIAYYNGGSARTISFSMMFHRDMVAPWTSAGIYGGMPAGIEANGSQFAGLYLTANPNGKEGLTSDELKKKYIEDYIRYYNMRPDIADDVGTAILSNQNMRGEADATARFHLFLNKIKALNYPVYNTNGIIPPKVYLKIGGDSNNGLGGLRLKGYCTTNINYDGIVKYNSLISATVDFTFTEVVDIAWSAPEVINGMQRYIQYMDQTVR